MDKVPSSILCWGVQTRVVVVQRYLVSGNMWGLFLKNSSLSRGQSRGMFEPQVEWVKILNLFLLGLIHCAMQARTTSY
jgi:hypothetical protein